MPFSLFPKKRSSGWCCQMLGPWSVSQNSIMKNFLGLPATGPKTTHLVQQGVNTKTLFRFPKAEGEIVKMRWHFVSFCVINRSFHSNWPWGGFKQQGMAAAVGVAPLNPKATWRHSCVRILNFTSGLHTFKFTLPNKLSHFHKPEHLRWRFCSSSACGYLGISDSPRD